MSSDDLRPATTEELLHFLDGAHSRNLSGVDGPRASKDPEGGDDPDCPPPSRYMEVALGVFQRGAEQILLNHAVDCAACAQTLAESLRALEGDPTPEEGEALAALAMAQPQHQREISLKLASSPAGRRPVFGRVIGQRLLWMGTTAAIFMAVAQRLSLPPKRYRRTPPMHEC